MKIGVFDSGKGGTVILEEIKRRLPDMEYCYIADSKNCPYGEKTDDELRKIVHDVSVRLIRWGASIIVIACNTATTKCIDYLRSTFPTVVFVGTEPAVKLAAKMNARRVLVLATPGTAHSERLLSLVEQNNEKHIIDVLACPGLADAVENNMDVENILKKLFQSTRRDYDVIVLGCTHYSLIKKQIQRYFPHSKLIDGNDGVANRVVSVIKNQL